MKLKTRNHEQELESFRIEIHGNEYLLKEVSYGLQIIEITDDTILIAPQTANSAVVVTRDNRKNKL